MPRTIKEKLAVLSAATAARKQAEAAESAAANALTTAAEPGEDVLGNGKMVVDLGALVGFSCFGGNIVKCDIVEVIKPDMPEPRPTPPAGPGPSPITSIGLSPLGPGQSPKSLPA
jgi:hypothetical protein